MLPESSRWDELKSNWPYLLTLAPLLAQWGRTRQLEDGWIGPGVGTALSVMTLALVAVIQAQRRKLEEASITDKLTGLFNSRHLRTELDRQVALAQRVHSPLSMIFLDVDEFKSFNDLYGHLTGDRFLRRVAQSLLHVVRQHVDLCFRYGGDEFLVLCPQTRLEEASEIAKRIAQMRLEPSRRPGEAVTLSMSITQLGEAESPRAFLQRADRALYQAKHSGKNRMSFAE